VRTIEKDRVVKVVAAHQTGFRRCRIIVMIALLQLRGDGVLQAGRVPVGAFQALPEEKKNTGH